MVVEVDEVGATRLPIPPTAVAEVGGCGGPGRGEDDVGMGLGLLAVVGRLRLGGYKPAGMLVTGVGEVTPEVLSYGPPPRGPAAPPPRLGLGPEAVPGRCSACVGAIL